MAGASRQKGQQGAVQGRGPHLPAGPDGQDVFPAGPKQDSAGEVGTIRPHATVTSCGTSTTARGPGKDLCPPGASEARGRLREPAQRRTLTRPGGTPVRAKILWDGYSNHEPRDAH